MEATTEKNTAPQNPRSFAILELQKTHTLHEQEQIIKV